MHDLGYEPAPKLNGGKYIDVFHADRQNSIGVCWTCSSAKIVLIVPLVMTTGVYAPQSRKMTLFLEKPAWCTHRRDRVTLVYQMARGHQRGLHASHAIVCNEARRRSTRVEGSCSSEPGNFEQSKKGLSRLLQPERQSMSPIAADRGTWEACTYFGAVSNCMPSPCVTEKLIFSCDVPRPSAFTRPSPDTVAHMPFFS